MIGNWIDNYMFDHDHSQGFERGVGESIMKVAFYNICMGFSWSTFKIQNFVGNLICAV